MTVTRVGATVVFLGVQFLPTFKAFGRPPYYSVLLAPLTWALALTFSFTAMWECEFDTLSLNLLFGGATGVFVSSQFGLDWRRSPRDWTTRLVGGALLLLYVIGGSLQGNGRLVRNYGPNICKVASLKTPWKEFAAPLAAYAKVGSLAAILMLATISGNGLLPWRWCSRRPAEPQSGTSDRGDGEAPPSLSPPPNPPESFFENPTAIAAMVFRCLMTGAFGAMLYGWNLDVDLNEPRNVMFAFASVRTRDWAVLLVAAIIEMVTLSVGVVAYTHHAEDTISWTTYKNDHLPHWSVRQCLRSWCCSWWPRRPGEDGPAAWDDEGGDEEAPAPGSDGHIRAAQANASPSGQPFKECIDNLFVRAPGRIYPDANGYGAHPRSPKP